MTAYNMIGECLAANQITSPKELLDLLNQKFNLWLNSGSKQFNDGMDIAFCFLNKTNHTIQFSGAGIPLFLVNGNGLTEVRGVSRGIGRNENQTLHFVNHEFTLSDLTTVFLSTDGFLDQFGGDLSKKYGKKRLKEMLVNVSQMKFTEIAQELEENFDAWKGKNEQTDDVTLIGFQVEL